MCPSSATRGQFFAEAVDASSRTLLDLTRSQPGNPFCTPSYVATMRRFEYQPWILGYRAEHGLSGSCIGFVRSGFLNRLLEIHSLPSVARTEEFWNDVFAFARKHHITQLDAQSYGSPALVVPAGLPNEQARRVRHEYVLKTGTNWEELLSTNHKRNIRKAVKAGLTWRLAQDSVAVANHVELMGKSMMRRRGRGEYIEGDPELSRALALVESGAAILFQCFQDNEPLSSVLILRSSTGAYYQSAGTSPAGMALGASHFLIYTIAKSLLNEGAESFNLGGAQQESSLARFKSGFGTSIVSTTAVRFYTGPKWKRKATTLVTLIREDPRLLKKLLTGEIKPILVYSYDFGEPPAPLSIDDAQFFYLSEKDIVDLEPDDCGFRERQLHRLKRFGESFAYGVKVNGQVGHISWLLPPTAVRRDSPPTLRLLPDEAEISGCETMPSLRGRGLYPFAIAQLLTVAHARGIRRVYMKTAADNQASQTGISKAGLKPAGTLFSVTLPLLSGRTWSVVRWNRSSPLQSDKAEVKRS